MGIFKMSVWTFVDLKTKHINRPSGFFFFCEKMWWTAGLCNIWKYPKKSFVICWQKFSEFFSKQKQGNKSWRWCYSCSIRLHQPNLLFYWVFHIFRKTFQSSHHLELLDLKTNIFELSMMVKSGLFFLFWNSTSRFRVTC